MTRENEPRTTWTEFAARHSMGDVLRATVTKTVELSQWCTPVLMNSSTPCGDGHGWGGSSIIPRAFAELVVAGDEGGVVGVQCGVQFLQ